VNKTRLTSLRKQAEAQLLQNEQNINTLKLGDLQKIAHELAVHQVELEIQNEELRQARTAAEEARDMYLDLYNFAPVGYFTIDEHSRIIEVNLAGLKLLNVETRHVMLLSRFTKYIRPEESDLFHFYHRLVLGSDDRKTLEINMQKADGSTFQAQLLSIKAGLGTIRIAVIDISERKKLEELRDFAKKDLEIKVLERTKELRESEEDYRRIIETANEGIFITDPDGNILFINNKFTDMIGYTRDEIVGRQKVDFLVEGETEAVLKMRGLLDQNKKISNELQFRHKNGSAVWVLASAAPLVKNGVHIRNLYMMTDITERKITEDELKDVPRRILLAQEAEREQIGRELHDEVGQSLTYLAILLDKITRVPPESVKGVVDETRDVNKKVLGQVRNLLVNLQPGKLEHLGLILTLEQYFTDYTAKTGIHVEFQPQGSWVKIPYALSLVIYRICQEALTNIARYSGVKESRIILKKNSKVITLIIEDKGSGFTPGLYRKDASGLVGMRERARMVGGVLKLETAPGKGTKLSVEIPLKSVLVSTKKESETK
jgi:PAS domain S-box-containing protein